jgi:hypothetical protein
MATANGTAAGAGELWDILLDFLQGNGWEITDRDSATDGNESKDCVQLKGSDVSGEGAIHVHMIYRSNVLQDVYAFQMEGSAGWLPDSDVKEFGRNPQNSFRDVGTTTQAIVRVPLHSNPIQYWITASPRRFMGAFRHNDRWGTMYCGFVLPYGMPSQWAYPLWIAGNNMSTDDYKENTNGCAWGASAVPSGMLYCPSGRWQITPAYTYVYGSRGYAVRLWPWGSEPSMTHLPYYKPLRDKNGVERYPVTNMFFYCLDGNEYGVFGEPEGLCHATSWAASGGDVLSAGGRDYLLVQREMSTANDTSAAMLLE